MDMNQSQPADKPKRRYLRGTVDAELDDKKIQQYAALSGVQHMRMMSAENRRNSESEAAAVRRKLWGERQDGNKVDTDEEMGTTILGDVTHSQPIVIPQQQSSLLPVLALAASTLIPLSIAGAGLGSVATYLLMNRQPQQQQTQQPANKFDDSTLEIGLGRIEDYLEKDAK